jgi:hypothetical protein
VITVNIPTKTAVVSSCTSGDDKTIIMRTKSHAISMRAKDEKTADSHPKTIPPVSRVRQKRKLLTVGNLIAIVTFFTLNS